MNAIKNFEVAVEALKNSAPSDKAIAFAEKLAAQVRAKGDEWIEAHVSELNIFDTAVYDNHLAPIADNRMFYLSQWQLALAA